MECKESIDIMLDIIYGEEVEPSTVYEFFEHLKDCSGCDREFRELTETRVMFREWSSGQEVGEAPQVFPVRRKPGLRFSGNWWGGV